MSPFGSMLLPLKPVNLPIKLSCHSGPFHTGCISRGESIAQLGAGLLVPLSCLLLVDLPSFKACPSNTLVKGKVNYSRVSHVKMMMGRWIH